MGDIDRKFLESFLVGYAGMTYESQITTAWSIFLFCIVTFGVVTITGDMEDYGREPGDIVWINIGDHRGVVGIFPEAITRAALCALKEEGR
jgi:hypothetical protein